MSPKLIKDPASFRVYKWDGVSAAGVYGGIATKLRALTDSLDWHGLDGVDSMAWLTLDEIRKQLPKEAIITVWISAPLAGEILQYGNYRDGKWYRIGETCGYW